MVGGTAMIHGTVDGAADLDNHFRYLSGLLFGIGVGFAACVPTIERRSELFLMLSGAVIVGGLARLFAVLAHGPGGTGDYWALMMELIVVPLLLAWQRRVASYHET
jgi:hypothetical protein